MRISELNDEDVLNFLMTSEFEGDYSPTELKYLLVKWRYFYRLSQGKNEQLKNYTDGEIEKLSEEVKLRDNLHNNLLVKVADKDNLIHTLKNRELSLKERFKGKIILTEDENKNL
jgi:hypothetical protein